MSTKAHSRAAREMMIIQTLAMKVQHGKKPECTVASMARSLGLEPSTHLRKIMNDMAKNGLLDWVTVPHRKNRDKKIYSLPSGSYQEPRKRSIALNIRGKEAGQLELPL